MSNSIHSERKVDDELRPLTTASSTSIEGRSKRLSDARQLLYVSHLFSQFSERAWQFSLILFLAAFTNYESYLLVSTYGVVTGLVVCLFGSRAGRLIDSSNRLFVARLFICTQNLAVLLATFFCWVLLSKQKLSDEVGPIHTESSSSILMQLITSRLNGVPLEFSSLLLLLGIHIFGAVAQVFDVGFTVAIERDWVVVMSLLAPPNKKVSPNSEEGDLGDVSNEISKELWLSDTNVGMKQIDLTCKVVAPAVAGFIIVAYGDGTHHGEDLSGAALLVGALNVSALFVEYVCTVKIYRLIPELALKSENSHSTIVDVQSNDTVIDDEKHAISKSTEDNVREEDASSQTGLECSLFKIPSSLGIYLEQPIAWGGIGLSLLYLNQLTFGAIMTAYLVWRGMNLETIGVLRGLSSAVGLMGTFAYSLSAKFLSVESTGLWSILFQCMSLTMCFASLFVESSDLSLGILITGVCASRVGLWVYDLAITQLMQKHVSKDVRGVVGGVQQSLNAFFGIFAFAIGIVFPNPRDFFIYIDIGWGSVFIAMLCYSFGVFARRQTIWCAAAN